MIQLEPQLEVKSNPIDLPATLSLLFILIFFILISVSLDFSEGMKLSPEGMKLSPPQLPRAESTRLERTDKLLMTLVPNEKDSLRPHVFFNNRPYKWEDLALELSKTVRARSRELKGEIRRPIISLKVDERIDYGALIKVFDIARRMQVEINLVTQTSK